MLFGARVLTLSLPRIHNRDGVRIEALFVGHVEKLHGGAACRLQLKRLRSQRGRHTVQIRHYFETLICDAR